jgi:hypothetical protein
MMRWQDIKWKQILIGFAATLAVLFAVHAIWQRAGVERPLSKTLALNVAVNRVVVTNSGRKMAVIIELLPVESLATTARDLSALAYELQPGISSLELVGKPSEELMEVYHQIHFALYEGAATREFSEMNKRVSDNASLQAMARYRLEVDEKAIYLQIHHGQDYLYKIIPLGGGGE